MLEIPLSPETEAALRKKASVRGEDVAIFAARLLQDALTAPSVEELLQPFRQQVDTSGVTDEDLDRLCDDLRQDVWDARHASNPKRV
jgi:hypothetical protein